MGGHHSRQSVSETTNTITNATYKSTQNCITVAIGSNTFSIYGNNNFVQNVDQSTSLSVDTACSQSILQDSNFSNSIANSVAQALKTQEQALESWATPGTSTSSAHVTNNIKTNITSDIVQNCLTQLSGQNVFSIIGSGNVTQGVLQSATLSKFGDCLSSGNTVTSASSRTTNSINQKMQDIQKSPFAFITDAIQAAVAEVAVIAGVVVLAIVLVVVIAKLLMRRKKAPPTAAPLPAPSYAPPYAAV